MLKYFCCTFLSSIEKLPQTGTGVLRELFRSSRRGADTWYDSSEYLVINKRQFLGFYELPLL